MWFFSKGLAVAVALVALPAAGADDCDPEVEQALAASAESGANDALVLVTHPDHGIVDPESIFDFGCVEGMFDFSHSNMLFDPGQAMSGILGLLERSICRAAQNAYRCYVGRGLDSSLFGLEAPRLGDLDFGVNCGASRRDAALERARDARSERERLLQEELRLERARRHREEPLPWLRTPGAAPETEAAPTRRSRRELFRDLLGGGDGR